MMHPDAAGINVGAEELVAAVPPGHAGADGPAVRTFSTFTSGDAELRDWLLACSIKTAAMEPKPWDRGADRLRRRSSPAGGMALTLGLKLSC